MQENEDRAEQGVWYKKEQSLSNVATTVGWQKATGSEVLGWDDLLQLVIPFRGSFKAFF